MRRLRKIANYLQDVHEWLLPRIQTFERAKLFGPSVSDGKDDFTAMLGINNYSMTFQTWDSGECDVYLLNMASGEALLNVTYLFMSSQEVIASAKVVFDLLLIPELSLTPEDVAKVWTDTKNDHNAGY